MDNTKDALAQWIAQQQADSLSQQPPELHLHQHHHQAPPVVHPPTRIEDPSSIRVPPLVVATYALFLSVALALPLTLIAVILETSQQPQIQYVEPRW